MYKEIESVREQDANHPWTITYDEFPATWGGHRKFFATKEDAETVCDRSCAAGARVVKCAPLHTVNADDVLNEAILASKGRFEAEVELLRLEHLERIREAVEACLKATEQQLDKV